MSHIDREARDDLLLQGHQAGEQALYELLDREGECDCPTCITREVLTAAWPYLQQAALEGSE